MGPFHAVWFEIGKAMGKKVKHDVVAADFHFSHADLIGDLKTDAGVSASYLKELIDNSTSKEHLDALLQYINDPAKAGNISEGLRESMVRLVNVKLMAITDHELIQALMEFLRTKADSVADFTDLFG